MTALSRQNALFSAEQWYRAYDALSNVSFRAYDQDSLRNAMTDYIRTNYPEEYNDWIGSSEFVIKLDILAWLSQNLSWRIDLNSRENFLATAERRESLLMLAQNISYVASRVTAASGEVKIASIQSSESIKDSDGVQIDRVRWNDPTDPDWLEKWTIVINKVLNARTPFGRPLKRYGTTGNTVSLYRLNSLAPATGVYSLSSNVSGGSLPFEIVNADLDTTDGTYFELTPNPLNAFGMLYRTDGLGLSSTGTGFFLPIKQGSIEYQDFSFSDYVSARYIDIDATNINEDDVWLCKVDGNGRILQRWTRVDSTIGNGIAFDQNSTAAIYEVITRVNDSIRIRFGDGKFGAIPIGNFRVWYRRSSPLARQVKSQDIRNQQIVIPYASGSRIYNLTVTFSLTQDLTNAVRSESNEDIRYRANKVFYSQNRMVNGEDYNSYFLKDTSILKVASINRLYSGHGSSIPLNDPTGTYNNIRAIGEDGRLFKQFVENETTISFDPTDRTLLNVVDEDLQPILDLNNKTVLYHNEYDEIPVSEYTWFAVDEDINERSRGRFKRDIADPYAAAVGDDASTGDPLKLVNANALIRLGNYRGEVVRVDYVVGNGTPTSGILLKDLVDTDQRVYSVFPAFRSTLTDDEKAAIISKMTLHLSFGLRWDQSELSWTIVNAEDLDLTSEYSIDDAGDTTETGKDASWVMRLEYKPVENELDRWLVYDRGLELVFESDKDIDFYYANTKPVVDAITGRALRDSIKLLRDNETRDSLPRRGLTSSFGADPNQGSIIIVGDGINDTFDLMAEVVDEDHVFVRRNGVILPNTQWDILHVPGLDQIKFSFIPTANEQINVIHDPHSKYLQVTNKLFAGNDVKTSFDVGANSLSADSAWVFVAGVLKRPGTDYQAVKSTIKDNIVFATPPSNAAAIRILSFYGSGSAFANVQYVGTGSRTNFSTESTTETIWVFVNGLLNLNFTISKADPSNYAIIFNAPPAANAKIDIRVLLWPNICTVKRYTTTSTASQDSLDITSLGVQADSASNILVWVDGEQAGWSYESNFIFFNSALTAGKTIHVTYFASMASPGSGYSVVVNEQYETQPTYLKSEVTWWVNGQLTHDDGYTNPNGVKISNVDLDAGGDADNPFLFRELVVQDGTDLVLWRRVTELGAEVWSPISPTTSPRGTYENNTYSFTVGNLFDEYADAGDIHYKNGSWLLADADTGRWITAPDQTAYKKEIGRSNFRFQWNHYSPEYGRINPSPANVIDTFVLTSGYHNAVKDWIIANRPIDEFPDPETTDALRIAYQEFENSKMISDGIVWYAAKYKPLFGSQAISALRAKIVVVKVINSNVPDNDLKLRILRAIDQYFDYRLWNFGDTFYFSELSAFIHRQLPSVVQSVVIVPRDGVGNFGRLYQVRSEPDELFISAAKPEDISIVTSLLDSDIKIT
jgi:hypothetical protein